MGSVAFVKMCCSFWRAFLRFIFAFIIFLLLRLIQPKEQCSSEKDLTTDVLTLFPWDKIRALVFYILFYCV